MQKFSQEPSSSNYDVFMLEQIQKTQVIPKMMEYRDILCTVRVNGVNASTVTPNCQQIAPGKCLH